MTVEPQNQTGVLESFQRANAVVQETSSFMGNIWSFFRQAIFFGFLGLMFGAPLLMFRENIRNLLQDHPTMQNWFDYAIAWIQSKAFSLLGGTTIESLGIDAGAAGRLQAAEHALATPEKVGTHISQQLGITDTNTANSLGAQAISAARELNISLTELTSKEGLQQLLLNKPDFLIEMLNAMPKDAHGKLVLSGDSALSQSLVALIQDENTFNALMANEGAQRVLLHAVKLSQQEGNVTIFEQMLKNSGQHAALRSFMIGLLGGQPTATGQQAPAATGASETTAEPPAAAAPVIQTTSTSAPVADLSELLTIAASLHQNHPTLMGELGALTGQHSGNNEAKIKAMLNYFATDTDGQALAEAIKADGDTVGLLRQAGISLPNMPQGAFGSLVSWLSSTTPEQMLEHAVDSAITNEATLKQLAEKVRLDSNGQLTGESMAAITPIIAQTAATARS